MKDKKLTPKQQEYYDKEFAYWSNLKETLKIAIPTGLIYERALKIKE